MMKFVPALVAALLVSTPAFAGPRVEVHAGWDRASAAGESNSDVMYGVGIGYDLPIGTNTFVGVDANYDGSSAGKCVSIDGDTACLDANRDLSVGGRFGFNLGQYSKLYALGGYTNAKVKASITSGETALSATDELDGFRLGVGYQRNSDIGAYFKIEYRYSNYEQDFSRNQVLAGVGFEF